MYAIVENCQFAFLPSKNIVYDTSSVHSGADFGHDKIFVKSRFKVFKRPILPALLVHIELSVGIVFMSIACSD
jgi:hypothetical protein